jgi:hypothetical protein
LADGAVAVDDLDEIQVYIAPRWQNVCDIKAPETGLEIKFSYVFLAAMALRGVNLAAYESYDDGLCHDADLIELAKRVKVIGDDQIADSAARVDLKRKDGQSRSQSFDLLSPIDPVLLGTRLLAKAKALIGDDRANDLWAMTNALEQVSASDLGAKLQG